MITRFYGCCVINSQDIDFISEMVKINRKMDCYFVQTYFQLTLINIIIDIDQSPKIRINLNFPASSGSLIFPLPNPVPVWQNPANQIIY